MPLYEYKCAKCGNVFEVLQKFSDEPLKKHQGCGGKLEKLISRSGIQFKGSGWYVTDYGRKGTSSALPDHGAEGAQEKSEKPEKEGEKKPAAGEATGGKAGASRKGSKKD